MSHDKPETKAESRRNFESRKPAGPDFTERFERSSQKTGHKTGATIEFTKSNTEQIPYKPDPNDERKLARLFASIFSEVQKQNIEPGSSVNISIKDRKAREIAKDDEINAKQNVRLRHIKVDDRLDLRVTRDQEGLHLHGKFGEMDFRKYLVGGPFDPGIKLGAPMVRATLDNQGDIKITFKNFIPHDRRNTPDDQGKTHPYEYMCKNIGPAPDASQFPKVSLQSPKDTIAQGKKFPPDVEILATDPKR